jgi:SWI/SNF-related matrix-associated actin-dependent regulator of chromatin subfamily A3
MCRAELKDKNCLVQAAIEEAEDEELDIMTKSSKTEALMKILQASRKDPKSKVVIFSQWTSFLNVIQSQLQEAGMKYARIDGSMPAYARDSGMAALESDPDTKILLASLSVCSVGLNLVAADTVILADSVSIIPILDYQTSRKTRENESRCRGC